MHTHTHTHMHFLNRNSVLRKTADYRSPTAPPSPQQFSFIPVNQAFLFESAFEADKLTKRKTNNKENILN